MEMNMKHYNDKVYNMIQGIIHSSKVKLKQTYYDSNKLFEVLHSYSSNTVNINVSKLHNNNGVMTADISVNIIMNINVNIERTTTVVMDIVQAIQTEFQKNLCIDVIEIYPNNEGTQVIFVMELETT